MMPGIRRGLLLILLLASLMVILSGCGDYENFTLKKGIAHFSFEYPARYRVGNVETRDDTEYKYTDVGLYWVPPQNDRRANSLDLLVLHGCTGDPDSKFALEERLSLQSKVSKDFKLLERLTVTVAGVEGQEAIFSYTALTPDPGYGHPAEPTPMICRLVYFCYGGLIWGIDMSSEEAEQEEAKADFEHILQTLKILD